MSIFPYNLQPLFCFKILSIHSPLLMNCYIIRKAKPMCLLETSQQDLVTAHWASSKGGMIPDLLKKKTKQKHRRKRRKKTKEKQEDKSSAPCSREDKQCNFSFHSTLHIKTFSSNRNCNNVSATKTALGTSACLGADKWEWLGLAGHKTDQVWTPDIHVSTAEIRKPHKIWYTSLGCLAVTWLHSLQTQRTRSKHRQRSCV